MLKKYLIPGLIVLLPLALTLFIVMFIFNVLTTPFVGVVRSVMGYFGWLDKGLLFLSAEDLQIIVSKVIALVLLFGFTVFLGMIGRKFVFHYLLKIWEKILHSIPIVRTIYKLCQDVINTIFASTTNSFKQVVLVPFPNVETRTLGLVTCEHMKGVPSSDTDNIVAVFVPTTPNPTSGFLLMFKQSDLIYLDMKVEEAFKYIISCGVIAAQFKEVAAAEVLNRSCEVPKRGEP